MSDTTMIPFTGNDGLSAGVGGALGALVGNWWANGVGGWGGAYNRAPGCCDSGRAADTILTSSVLSDLSNISDQVNGVSTSLLQSQSAQNIAMAQGFSGINDAINRTAAGTESSLCAGFANMAGTITSGNTATRFENMSNFANLGSQLADCCCKTQTALSNGFGSLALENCHNTGAIVGAIKDEGSVTRGLINQNYIHELETKLCDAKSKIGALESQAFTSAAIAAQSAVFDNKLTNAVNTIITHVKDSTTTTT